MDPDMDDAMIRVKLPDPSYYNRWIDVGYIQPLDGNQSHFKLVILDEYEGMVENKVEDLVFYFTGVSQESSYSAIRPLPVPQNMTDVRNLGIYTLRWMCGSVGVLLFMAALFQGKIDVAFVFAALAVSSIPLLDSYLQMKGIRYGFWARILTVVAAFILMAII